MKKKIIESNQIDAGQINFVDNNQKHAITITARIPYDNGIDYIGAGIVTGSPSKEAILGLRIVQNDKVVAWIDYSVGEALTIAQVINDSVRHYLRLTDQDKPMNLKSPKLMDKSGGDIREIN